MQGDFKRMMDKYHELLTYIKVDRGEEEGGVPLLTRVLARWLALLLVGGARAR